MAYQLFLRTKKKVTLGISSRYADALMIQKGAKSPIETIGY